MGLEKTYAGNGWAATFVKVATNKKIAKHAKVFLRERRDARII